jgi:hypothetical protein
MTLLLLAAMLAAPDDPKPAVATIVGGGAMVSPDAKFVCAPGKDGVELIDIATGKPLWTNKDAAKVAGASDKVVLAWAADEKKPNAFRVVMIDVVTGKTLTKSEQIEMPDWATTAKVGGRSFRTGAQVEQDAVIVVWQANANYYGGARPTPQVEAAARKSAVGVVSIDMKAGKVATLDRKPKAEEFGAFSSNVGGYEFRVTEMLPGFKPGAAMMTKVTMTVLKDKKELWTRELAGNPWSPPPP